VGIPLLSDVVIIFGLSMVVLFVCHRLHIPTIVGFLCTGVLAGPHGLGIIEGVHDIELLAEVGVVLLLFTIGIEFSLASLLHIKKAVLLGGSLQVVFTIGLVMVCTKLIGYSMGEATFIGCLLALSSTAIVLKLLQERAEIDSPHGRTALAILIFQDLIVVPMMLVTPLLSGKAEGTAWSMLWPMLKGLGIVAMALISARWMVPQVLYQIARTRSRELFLLSVVVMCFAVAWLTSSVGLSLALGAFLAGLIISESEYSHQALGNVLPFRDVFTSFFFVSVGMLLDVGALLQHPGQIALIAGGILLLKGLVVVGATVVLGFPLRTAIISGLALCQVGEFAFVLAKAGQPFGLLAGATYQFFLAASILTMAAAPFIMALAPRLADLVLRLRWPTRLKAGLYPMPGMQGAEHQTPLHDHLLIIGYGINGRNVARAARIAGIPYRIIEMNPDTVRSERTQGEPIDYGDATQEAVLEHAGIHTARVVVVAISDPAATRNIVGHIRRIRPAVYIIARTRYLREVPSLYALGANEVIPEEFETSVEIFTRVLMKYLVPQDEIEKFVAEVRADGYEMFRSLARVPTSFADLHLTLADVDIRTFRVDDDSPLVGKTLADIALRRQYGVTLVAIRRSDGVLSNPGGDTELQAHDILVLLGTPEQFPRVIGLFTDAERVRG
jgi:CPA2 family monovalent cation:H+ antiporter-2